MNLFYAFEVNINNPFEYKKRFRKQFALIWLLACWLFLYFDEATIGAFLYVLKSRIKKPTSDEEKSTTFVKFNGK